MSKHTTGFVLLLTYGLSSPCRAADVEGNGSHHGHKTAVKQAHDAAKYQEGLNIIEVRTQRKEFSASSPQWYCTCISRIYSTICCLDFCGCLRILLNNMLKVVGNEK
jgi:hypothetical protein